MTYLSGPNSYEPLPSGSCSDIVAVGEDWGVHPSSSHHIMMRLAAQRRILWVNSLGLRRPRLTTNDIGRAVTKVKHALSSPRAAVGASPGSTKLPPSISLLSPLAISWPSSSLAFATNRRLLSRQVRKRMDQLGIERPVLWTSIPSALPLVGALQEQAVVYYCGDDFGSLVGVDHEPILRMERALSERADLVIAASEALCAKFPPSKTMLLPHGADVELFGVATVRPRDLPTGGKIAGFYGSISDWIDVDLLAGAARKLSDWTFFLIGPVHTDISALRILPNVVFAGPRPHASLPGYVQHWDVSLIPFRDTPQIRACNPLKLREYLAAGTPIASVDFPALAPYRQVVSLVGNRADLADAVLEADQDRARSHVRKASVSADSWDARAAVVAQRLDALSAGGEH